MKNAPEEYYIAFFFSKNHLVLVHFHHGKVFLFYENLLIDLLEQK